jgi:hypothetical protein
MSNDIIAATQRDSPNSQSPVGTENDEASRATKTTAISATRKTTKRRSRAQSPVGTGNSASQSPVGTDPFPVLRLQEDSLLVPKDSPLPPSGGAQRAGSSFGKSSSRRGASRSRRWRWQGRHGTASKPPSARRSSHPRRGYWAWLKAHPKPPSAQSAQSFIRDTAGWGQWLRYVPDASGVAPSILTGYARSSVEARALINLHDALGADEGFRKIYVREAVTYRKPMTDQIRAFADMPPRAEWIKVSHQGAGAWSRFAPDVSMVSRTRAFREGDLAPWIFPPSVTGKTYSAATGPPAGELTPDDIEAFANEGQR